MQAQSDLLGVPVFQAAQAESTALGAAFLAGLQAGVWRDLTDLRRPAQEARPFRPQLQAGERELRLIRWRRAVDAVIKFYTGDRQSM